MNRSCIVFFLSVALMSACASTPEVIEDPAADSTDGDLEASPTADPQGSSTFDGGFTFENPLFTCGVHESYAVVASLRCVDGTMPLGGDTEAARAARQGSLDSHIEGTGALESHIVDLYLLPCSDGARSVFVCMYHCSPSEQTPGTEI